MNFVAEFTIYEEFGGEQFLDFRHIDAVEAGSDDWRAGNAHVDLAGATQLADPVQQNLHGGVLHISGCGRLYGLPQHAP